MNKQTLFSAVATVMALIVGLAAGEILIRVKNSSMTNYDIEMWRYARELRLRSPDPALAHEHIPNKSALLQNVNIRINADGLRGPDIPAPAAEQRRVLFLGSSITLGWGVAEDETLTAQVAKGLAERGEPAVVMNGGVADYNAPRYVRRFLTRLSGLQPTDIVVQAFVRDGEALEARSSNWLLRNSQLAMTLWIATSRVLDKGGEAAVEARYRETYAPGAPGRAAMEQALAELAAYARQHNIRLYMLMTPDVHDLANYRLDFVHQVFREVAERNGYRFLDSRPYFGDLSLESLWVMPGDPHPNARGHALMAKAALDLLAKR